MAEKEFAPSPEYLEARRAARESADKKRLAERQKQALLGKVQRERAGVEKAVEEKRKQLAEQTRRQMEASAKNERRKREHLRQAAEAIVSPQFTEAVQQLDVARQWLNADAFDALNQAVGETLTILNSDAYKRIQTSSEAMRTALDEGNFDDIERMAAILNDALDSQMLQHIQQASVHIQTALADGFSELKVAAEAIQNAVESPVFIEALTAAGKVRGMLAPEASEPKAVDTPSPPLED
ncbi:MAG: hypothetical protein Q9M24_06950 [Mariprofundaceae bacterium]|nr:hypothetical protein [Mariprofundaceae bacterium]